MEGKSCTEGLQFNGGLHQLYNNVLLIDSIHPNKAVLHAWMHAAVQQDSILTIRISFKSLGRHQNPQLHMGGHNLY